MNKQMVDKSIKIIGFFCLCLASLGLTGCFHVPDEDWLPSRNKVKTEDINKYEEIENAMDSFLQGIDMVSTERNKLNEENNKYDTENSTEKSDEIIVDLEENIDDETINNEDSNNNEIENQEIQEDIISEE